MLRAYNHDYYSEDNEDHLWMFVTERYVAARNSARAELLFIEHFTHESEEANNLHGQGTSYLPPIHDRQIRVVDWTGQWQVLEDKEYFLRTLITDPEDAHD